MDPHHITYFTKSQIVLKFYHGWFKKAKKQCILAAHSIFMLQEMNFLVAFETSGILITTEWASLFLSVIWLILPSVHWPPPIYLYLPIPWHRHNEMGRPGARVTNPMTQTANLLTHSLDRHSFTCQRGILLLTDNNGFTGMNHLKGKWMGI